MKPKEKLSWTRVDEIMEYARMRGMTRLGSVPFADAPVRWKGLMAANICLSFKSIILINGR